MSETTIKFQIYIRFDDETPTTPPHLLMETLCPDDINDIIKALYRNGALDYIRDIIIRIAEVNDEP